MQFVLIILTYLVPVLFTFYIQGVLNMVYTLRFFSLQNAVCFNNSNVFGSCIIHILYTGCAKHGIYSPFFFLFKMQFVLIILTYLVPVLFTFYIQVC